MKKIKINFLIAIVILSAFLIFAACSGESTLPDGAYKFEKSQGSPFDVPKLGVKFEVNGNIITVELTEELVFKYEHIIKGNEITLTDENGDEVVLAFKKDNNSYTIDKTTYSKKD